MDVGRVGSLFIRGPERTLLGRDMVFTLVMKRAVDRERLFASYEALVRAHEALRIRLVEEGDTFLWQAMSPAEVEARLARERASCLRTRPLDPLEGERSIRGDGLPLRYVVTGEREVTVYCDHAIANGYGALRWIEAWVGGAYAGADAGPRHATERAASPTSTSSVTNRVASLGSRPSLFAALLWTLLYLLTFLLRAGRRAASETVDLTRGKLPEVHALGYAVRTHRFSRDETTRIVEASRAAGRTVTETVCEAVAHALFALQPEKRRLLVSLPVDLSTEAAAGDDVPGNFTGSLLVQLFRDRPLAPQIHAAFRGFRRGVPFGVARIVASTAKTERALRDRFAAQARLPIPARAPFENFSCAVSSLGVLSHPALREHVAGISAHGMTQTLFFGVMTLGGELSIEVAAANDLFDARDVERAFSRITRALARGPRDTAEDARESGTRPAAAGVG